MACNGARPIRDGGGVGFLPNRDIESVRRDLMALPARGDAWLAKHTRMEFPKLHNNAYKIPVDHPVVCQMVESAKRMGVDTRIRGMIASCDAKLFNKVAGMAHNSIWGGRRPSGPRQG